MMWCASVLLCGICVDLFVNYIIIIRNILILCKSFLVTLFLVEKFFAIVF